MKRVSFGKRTLPRDDSWGEKKRNKEIRKKEKRLYELRRMLRGSKGDPERLRDKINQLEESIEYLKSNKSE